LQRDFLFLFVLAAFYSLPTALAQEGQELAGPSQEDIERYDELQRLANEQRIETDVQEDQTGTDPRSFSNKWMPFFRSQKLENGLKQYDLTAFGTVGFSPQVGMFYEVPLAQYRDFRDISGFPPGADATVIGVGDTSLKFLVNLEATRFTFGKDGEKSGSVLLGTDFVLPTAPGLLASPWCSPLFCAHNTYRLTGCNRKECSRGGIVMTGDVQVFALWSSSLIAFNLYADAMDPSLKYEL